MRLRRPSIHLYCIIKCIIFFSLRWPIYVNASSMRIIGRGWLKKTLEKDGWTYVENRKRYIKIHSATREKNKQIKIDEKCEKKKEKNTFLFMMLYCRYSCVSFCFVSRFIPCFCVFFFIILFYYKIFICSYVSNTTKHTYCSFCLHFMCLRRRTLPPLNECLLTRL